MKNFKYIVRDESELPPEKPQGVLIGKERYRCMDAKFDGEKYHFAMASLDEKSFLYTTQENNKQMEVIKSFPDAESIGQFWRLRKFNI